MLFIEVILLFILVYPYLSGVYLGPMVGLAVSGAITHYCGWQYVYYVHGKLAHLSQ